MIGKVKAFKRGTDEGALFAEVQVDPGGGANVTADYFEGSGVDAPPLAGDLVALVDGPGAGAKIAAACFDPKNAGIAAQGEWRVIVRAPDGSLAIEIWGKGNGQLKITSLTADGTVDINGFVIDKNGNATTPGDVTAKNASPATSVTLSSHLHPTGTGPSGPPQGGT